MRAAVPTRQAAVGWLVEVVPALRLTRDRLLGRLPSRMQVRAWKRRAHAAVTRRRVAYAAFVLAGLVFGLVWALPIPDVSHRCPYAGEGKVFCTIQKGYGAGLVKLAGALLLAHALSELVLRGIPAMLRHRRAGNRPAIRRLPAQSPEGRTDVDPLLHAASWGMEQPAPRAGDDAPPSG